MKQIWLLVLILNISIAGIVNAQQKVIKDADLLKMAKKELVSAAKQYNFLKTQINPDQFPKAYFPENDSLSTSNSSWWCSGFYPGSLLYLYEQTKDASLKKEAVRILKVLEKEQFNKNTHDLGFMMFCSFGNLNRLEPKEEYKQVLLNSAKSLCTRFDPKLGVIKSWDSKKPADFLVIIDNMMNLELLFWATKVTGDSSYYHIAVKHADNTIKNHYRPDYSSYHVVNYSKDMPGEVQRRHTAQGYADESAWARGQAWGLYGFTLMYRATKDEKYLNQANKISDFILNHPNFPQDKIAYWDFNAPNIPDAKRDVSAAAIMASAWLELADYTNPEDAKKYLNNAKEILVTLSTDKYKAKPGTYGGFILKHSVGHLPAHSEVDVAISYADYYYIEALSRLVSKI
ncbi:glycoside hydrolase family 88 protein [Pedobacter sp. CG_S7]|uniref:glycoside hydrolase family 88 protein n=1 Tax=Pedobacter sp. CG_S7 TaxID=3143930 RepID=UPI003395B352